MTLSETTPEVDTLDGDLALVPRTSPRRFTPGELRKRRRPVTSKILPELKDKFGSY